MPQLPLQFVLHLSPCGLDQVVLCHDTDDMIWFVAAVGEATV